MNKQEMTVHLHMNGGLNCGQAILTVYGEPLGIDAEKAKLLGRPLGGGFGALGRTCGYLTGAMLVLAHAHHHEKEDQSRVETKKAVGELFRRFEEKHGGSLCRDLLDADMSTKAGAKTIQDEKRIAARCPAFGTDAAMILEDLLASAGEFDRITG